MVQARGLKREVVPSCSMISANCGLRQRDIVVLHGDSGWMFLPLQEQKTFECYLFSHLSIFQNLFVRTWIRNHHAHAATSLLPDPSESRKAEQFHGRGKPSHNQFSAIPPKWLHEFCEKIIPDSSSAQTHLPRRQSV